MEIYQKIPTAPTKKAHQLSLFEEASLYHSVDRTGFFALCHKANAAAKLQQRSYPLEHMPFVIESCDKSLDTYLSQGEFYRPNRRVIYLSRIGLAFADLDYYQIPQYRDLRPEQVAWLIHDFCNQEGFFPPSLILSSGRGLYLKWIFSSAIPAAALPRWNVLQQALVSSFASFGADQRARDASRILRLENTVNTRTGQKVRVIWPKPGEEPVKYNFEDLFREWAPLTREEWHHAKQHDRRQLHLIPGKGQITGLKSFSIMQLNWDRLADLRHLAELRGWTQGNPDGHRDAFLFPAACFLSWIVAPGQLHHEMLSLARQWAPHWTLDRLHNVASAATRRAQMAAEGKKIEYQGNLLDPRYRFSNIRLIDWLQITPDEEAKLKTIISKPVKKERHRVAEAGRRRREGLVKQSRGEYLEQSAALKVQVHLLKGEGLKGLEIAAKLGITPARVSQILKIKCPCVCMYGGASRLGVGRTED